MPYDEFAKDCNDDLPCRSLRAVDAVPKTSLPQRETFAEGRAACVRPKK